MPDAGAHHTPNNQRAVNVATKKDIEHLTQAVYELRDESRDYHREFRECFEQDRGRIRALETEQAVLSTSVTHGNRDSRVISGVAALGAFLGGVFFQKPGG